MTTCLVVVAIISNNGVGNPKNLRSECSDCTTTALYLKHQQSDDYNDEHEITMFCWSTYYFKNILCTQISIIPICMSVG